MQASPAHLPSPVGHRRSTVLSTAGAMGCVLLGCLLGIAATGSESTVRDLVTRAQTAATAKDPAAGYKAIREAVADPAFGDLSAEERHAALELGYEASYANKDFASTHEFATRATQLPQESAKDWWYRLQSAFRNRDARDEAVSVAGLVRLPAGTTRALTHQAVSQAFRDTRAAEYADARKQMLLALYDHHWRPEEGDTGSYLWLTLCRMLLEGNEESKALQVASLVDEPDDIITMHADRRFERLLKAPHFEPDAHRAQQALVKKLRAEMAQRPRSLELVLRLSSQLIQGREEKEALSLIARAELKIANAPVDAPPFDDIPDNRAWLVTEKARALRDLGDFQGALAEYRRAVSLPHESDSVSQGINLAQELCAMGRFDEAVDVVPKMEDASEYGKNQIVYVGLAAAAERDDKVLVKQLLEYLDQHKMASPQTFLDALLIAGESDRAQAFLLARLADPELRSSALLELQTYADKPRPPKSNEWHTRFEKLRGSPEVQRGVAQVGAIGQYTWRYN